VGIVVSRNLAATDEFAPPERSKRWMTVVDRSGHV